MTTAIDTNVLVALWDVNDVLNKRALSALNNSLDQGGLVVCGAVFVELVAGPRRSIEIIENFLTATGIAIDWMLDEAIWRRAAIAFHDYAKRRRKQKQPEPKRVLTDFLVGAHALERGVSLLTFDERIFSAAFPKLKIVS